MQTVPNLFVEPLLMARQDAARLVDVTPREQLNENTKHVMRPQHVLIGCFAIPAGAGAINHQNFIRTVSRFVAIEEEDAAWDRRAVEEVVRQDDDSLQQTRATADRIAIPVHRPLEKAASDKVFVVGLAVLPVLLFGLRRLPAKEHALWTNDARPPFGRQ
jgi:hypothetical protein